MSVTVARLTRAESSQFLPGASVSQSALLTVLPLVTLRTGAALNPAGRHTWGPPGRYQGDVVEVTGTCGDEWLVDDAEEGARVGLLRVLVLLSL